MAGEASGACQIGHLPDGGGGGPVSSVSNDPQTDTAARGAVAEGSADMTVANRLPAQPMTRGHRCRCVPTPAGAIRWTSKPPFFAPTRLPQSVVGRKSACGFPIRRGSLILVLEWPGGGVGRTLSGTASTAACPLNPGSANPDIVELHEYKGLPASKGGIAVARIEALFEPIPRTPGLAAIQRTSWFRSQSSSGPAIGEP